MGRAVKKYYNYPTFNFARITTALYRSPILRRFLRGLFPGCFFPTKRYTEHELQAENRFDSVPCRWAWGVVRLRFPGFRHDSQIA